MKRIIALALLMTGLAAAAPLPTHQKTFDLPPSVHVVETLPVVSGNEAFNTRLDRLVGGLIGSFAREAQLTPKTFKPPYTLTITPEYSGVDGRFVSVVLHATRDFHGNHPGHTLASMLYDTKSQRILALGDLFKARTGYLKVISQYCKKHMKVAFPAGLAPKADNFSAFSVQSGQLVIHFQIYQVASYADGEVTEKIPTAALKALVRPDGPLH